MKGFKIPYWDYEKCKEEFKKFLVNILEENKED